MNHEVLGVGAPLLDHLLQVDEAYLETVPGEKHGMETVEYPAMVQIIEGSHTVPKQIAGGSCANAIKGLASLGQKCAMTGKIGKDAIGEKVHRDLLDQGITPLLHYSSTPTGHVTCLITPDGKRTCRAYLGASQEMGPDDLKADHFSPTKLVHIEGYTLLCSGLTHRAMELAKEAGAKISFDLGSFEIVESYRNLVMDLVSEYVDILFANEDETLALTGEDPQDGCEILKTLTEVAVVMIGKKGCWVGHGSETFHVPGYPIDQPIDTTGAGDLFASGFLHGYLEGRPLAECAKYGALTGNAVVQVVGAEIPESMWADIKQKINNS